VEAELADFRLAFLDEHQGHGLFPFLADRTTLSAYHAL